MKLHSLVLATMCACWFTAKAATAPASFLRLEVMVVDSHNHTPIEAATVNILGISYSKLSNEKGIATFDSVPYGKTTIRCMAIGYNAWQEEVQIKANMKITVMLCLQTKHLHDAVVEGHLNENTDLNLWHSAKLNSNQLNQQLGLGLSNQLRLINGVSVLSSGPNITKPVVRGLHSNRLVTVNQDIRQEGQQWGNDHGLEIDPFSVQEVEVIKGASSVAYGSEAIGGVLKILSPEFKQQPGIDGKLMLTGATNNGLFGGSLKFEGKHFKKNSLSWLAQGSFRKAGDSKTPQYVLSNTGLTEISGQYGFHVGANKWHFTFNQSFFYTQLGILRASHVGNATDLSHAIASGYPVYVAPFSYHINKPQQNVSHVLSALKVRYDGFGVWHLNLSRQINQRDEYDRPAAWMSDDYANKPQYSLFIQTDLVELNFEHKKKKKIKGTWGLSWMNQGNSSEGIQPIIPNFRAYTTSIFGLEKWQSGRWHIESGLRYDNRSQTKFEWVKNQVADFTQTYSGTTFHLGAGYYISEIQQIGFYFSSGWRAPSMNELYSYGLHGGTATFETGNPTLTPESSINTEVFWKLEQTNFFIEVNVFSNKINHFIYKVPLPNPIITVRGAFPNYLFVQDHVRISGFETNLKQQITTNWHWSIQINYLYAQNITDNTPLIFMPANNARASVGYQTKKWLFINNPYLNITCVGVAQQKRYPKGIDFTDPPAGYAVVDVAFGCTIKIGKNQAQLNIGCYNLLNQSYRDYLNRFRYYTLEPGFNCMARLTIPFQIIK